MKSNIETELKLRLADESLYNNLIADPIFQKYASQEALYSEDSYNTYFDTENHDLSKAGYAYRIRRTGDNFTATVKDSGSIKGGLHSRKEWNVQVYNENPEIESFKNLPVGLKLRDLIGYNPLLPLFKIKFKRTLLDLKFDDGTEIEFAADLGEIISGEKREPICEVELELKKGNVSKLLKIGSSLASKYPLFMEKRSKFYRGLLLSGIKTLNKKHSSRPALNGSKNSMKEISKILIFYINEIGTAQENFLDKPDDPETLHKLRVTLRRFRSVLSFMKPLVFPFHAEKFIDIFREMGRETSKLRELDVIIEEWNNMILNGINLKNSLGELMELLLSRRILERSRVYSFFSKGITTAPLLDFWAWLLEGSWANEQGKEPSLAEFTTSRVETWLREVKKNLKDIEALDAKTIHDIRIKCKKARYILEDISYVLDKEYRKTSEKLKLLQEHLGNIHDASVNISFIKELVKEHSSNELHYESGIFAGFQLKKSDLAVISVKEIKL